jgi:hypothetical protein
MVVVIAEQDLELAAGPLAGQVREPILGVIGKGVGAGLVGPFEVESVAGQDEKVGLVGGVPHLREVILGPRAPAEEVQIGNETQSLSCGATVLFGRRGGAGTVHGDGLEK